jgi:hypothetical protein
MQSVENQSTFLWQTCRLHLQDLKPSMKDSNHRWHYLLLYSWLFLTSLALQPWRLRLYFRPKRQWTFKVLHGVIAHETELFNVQNTALRWYGRIEEMEAGRSGKLMLGLDSTVIIASEPRGTHDSGSHARTKGYWNMCCNGYYEEGREEEE